MIVNNFLPTTDVCQEHSRANDVARAPNELLDCAEDFGEDPLGVMLGIARISDRPIRRQCGSPSNFDQGTKPHSVGVASGRC